MTRSHSSRDISRNGDELCAGALLTRTSRLAGRRHGLVHRPLAVVDGGHVTDELDDSGAEGAHLSRHPVQVLRVLVKKAEGGGPFLGEAPGRGPADAAGGPR